LLFLQLGTPTGFIKIFPNIFSNHTNSLECSETPLTGETGAIVSVSAFKGSEPLPPLGGKQTVDTLDQRDSVLK
jgi:hypothetical protein